MQSGRSMLAILCSALAIVACSLFSPVTTPTAIHRTPTPSPPEPTPTRATTSVDPTATPTTPYPTRTTEPPHPTATMTQTVVPPSSESPCPIVAESMDDLMTSCPTQCELAWFDSHFDIEFDELAGLPPYACQNGLDPAGGPNPRLLVYQALRAMALLTFDQPLPWTDLNLFAWLSNAIDGIKFTTTSVSYCCDPDNRIVLKADLLSQPFNAVWYDPQYGTGFDSFVGLIVHEARHAEIGGHTCGHDDQTLEELGAWGVQYYYFIWLSEHSLGWLTAEQRTGAGYSANAALSRICSP